MGSPRLDCQARSVSRCSRRQSAGDMSSAAARSYDAIVIGSGPGGSTFAYALASGGARVLVVERGESLSSTGLTAPVSMERFGEKGVCVGGESKFFGDVSAHVSLNQLVVWFGAGMRVNPLADF